MPLPCLIKVHDAVHNTLWVLSCIFYLVKDECVRIDTQRASDAFLVHVDHLHDECEPEHAPCDAPASDASNAGDDPIPMAEKGRGHAENHTEF